MTESGDPSQPIETEGMRAILGIDSAWTETQPSGVALLRGDGGAWQCLGVAPSYRSFVAIARGELVDWSRPVVPSAPDVPRLSEAAAALAGAAVDVVAIDMPLSTKAIEGRRTADHLISRAFGARGCSVHSPSAIRPGRIADDLRRRYLARGYPLATATAIAGMSPALVEVYPHTALLALLGADYRVPYKIARALKYKNLRELSAAERRTRILAEWTRILEALAGTIQGIELTLPTDAKSNSALKRYEDALDALICAWVGIEYLAGRARAFGDSAAAIWTPVVH